MEIISFRHSHPLVPDSINAVTSQNTWERFSLKTINTALRLSKEKFPNYHVNDYNSLRCVVNTGDSNERNKFADPAWGWGGWGGGADIKGAGVEVDAGQ